MADCARGWCLRPENRNLCRVGDGIRNANRVVGVPLGNGFGAACEASLRLDHGPRKRSRVPTVDVDGIEAADCQVRTEPIGPPSSGSLIAAQYVVR